MKNNFFYNFSLGNINAKPSNNSETLSQILYGEKFKVLKNQKNWVKIKTNFDNYIGCLLYTSPSPRDMRRSRMPSSA